MSSGKSPYIKLALLLIVFIMVFFAPTREFLKITFFMGIPFLLLYGFMGRQRRYSILWILSGVLVLGVVAMYGYFMIHLPERIEARVIISEGGALVAEGKYDQAIEEYRQLEKLGQKEKMQEKINIAQQEKQAQQQLEMAQQKFAAGDKAAAREIVEKIPSGTRAAVKARELRTKLGL